MKPRFLAAVLLLSVAPAAVSSPCRAQTADDPTTAMARARFKEGVEFFDKGEFERARASFLQAYALKKHPAVLLNLAWSCLKSGHPLEAERYFKQFPADEKDVTDKQRADATDGLAQSRAKLGRIEVVATAGTEVVVDGERVGLTPLAEPVSVEAGAHTIKAKAADGATEVQSVTVLGGDKTVARFTRGTPPLPPVAEPPSPATAPPAPPPVATEAPAPPATAPSPPSTEPRPAVEHAPAKSFFPSNMVPVYVGGILTLAGAGVAVAMLEIKQSALDNAQSTEANIQSHGGSCPPTAANAHVAGLANACATFAGDNNDVNTDATLGNVALGVGIAALAGTVIYWIAADKSEKGDSARGATRVVVAPLVGQGQEGLLLSGEF